MPFATQVVPMPRWSTPVGCTKLILSIIVLALTAACCAIWGTYAAFSLSIFTASLSLVAFSYYLTALSFQPQLYTKWVVLVLESLSTLFWFVSPILLVGWLGANTVLLQQTWNVPVHGTTSYDNVGLSQRDLTNETLKLWSPPLDLIKPQRPASFTTPVRVDGQDAQHALRILVGVSAGLASMNFVLYGVTLVMFSINMTKPQHEASPAAPDEEAASEITLPARMNTRSNVVQCGITTPPVVAQPLRVNILPKDFKPKPQTQGQYLAPEQVAEAGFEPPTLVLRARMAEKEKEKERPSQERKEEKAEGMVPDRRKDSLPVNPFERET